MSEPTSIAVSTNLFEANQLPKRKSLVDPFPSLLPNPFVDSIILFVKAAVVPSSIWYLIFFIS